MSTSDEIKTTIVQATNALSTAVSKEPREIIRHLGVGGMGEVFLCLNPLFDAEDPHCKEPRTVAVKTLSPELMQDREVLKRFEAEARALSPIQHRNVVRLHDWGKFSDGDKTGQHYISMEFIEGISLHRLGRMRRLSFPDVIDIGIQICEGLDTVHKHGVIHRDLKPANIMITHDGVAKIIDFGIAKPTSLGTGESDSAERGFKTKTGTVIGTVNYLAPELLLGTQATVKSDLYAVGLIIWEIISGATPFKTPSLAETMRRISEESLPWSAATLDIAPPGFIKLINQVTSKDPSRRPTSASELAQKLLRVRADAQWSASLNRKSRLDLNITWSNELLEKFKLQGVADEDLFFVLQGVEDQLIIQKDARLKSGEPIDVEESLITQALDAFKSARYQSAMVRQARLKADMLAASKNPTSATDRVATKTNTQQILQMGTPPPVAEPIDKNVISDRVRTATIAQSRNAKIKDSGDTTTAFSKILAGAIAIALTAGIINYSTNMIREGLPMRGPANDGEIVLISSPSKSRVNEILNSFPALKPGLSLVYDTHLTETNQPKKESTERRDLSAIENGRLLWVVDERHRVNTSILALPLDIFFNSINRVAENTTVEMSNTVSPETIEVGQTIHWRLRDTITGNSENTACRAVSNTPTTFQGINQLLWRIECDREAINKTGVLTHRTKEFYEFALGSGVLTSFEIQTEEFKLNTATGRHYKRNGTLNTRLSTFKN